MLQFDEEEDSDEDEEDVLSSGDIKVAAKMHGTTRAITNKKRQVPAENVNPLPKSIV